MIGIYDCFGYGPGYDVSFEERYRLIKKAGFDCVMLWWSDKFSIPTMVLHLPNDSHPINPLGMERLGVIIEEAEKYGIQIAFENLRNIRNLAFVLDSFHS